MADHNTLIGSTTGEIEGGTVLIGGVGCEIENGLVLVGGVAREIAFDGGTVTVKITGNGSTNGNYCLVEINGTEYGAAATVEVEVGTEIICRVKTSSSARAAEITHNGSTKASTTTVNLVQTYTFAVTENASIQLDYNSTYRYGRITITDE